MARGAMPWTARIEELLSDGEWHAVADVVAAGAEQVPAERALAEMGGRAAHSDDEARTAAGAKTLAKQSLMGMVRFGKATLSGDKKEVRKSSEESTSLGALAARVAALEERIAALEGVILSRISLSDEDVNAAFSGVVESDRVLDSAPGTVSGTVTGSSRAPDQVWTGVRSEDAEANLS